MSEFRCVGCGKQKSVNFFKRNAATKRGHENKCRPCRNKATREYKAKNPWTICFYAAKQRCINKNDPGYKHYGGRGIRFLLTMAEIKEIWARDRAHLLKNHSLDRININGNYESSNCRFIELSLNVRLANHNMKITGAKKGGKRISEETVGKIKYFLTQGLLTQRQIADNFGISPIRVSTINLNKQWAHVRPWEAGK